MSPPPLAVVRAALGVALTVLGAALLTAPGAQAKASQRCAEAKGRTVAANGMTRVYVRQSGGGTYACALPGGQSFPLGDQDQYPDLADVAHVAVAGRYVAYTLIITNRTGMAAGVAVVDARARRAVRRLPFDGEEAADVGSLVVTAAGTVAWIAERPTGLRRVWVARAKAVPAVVGEGSDIDGASLALGSGRVFWMQGDTPRTAPL